MWLSLRAISRASSAANSRRICSSALGGTIRSAVEPPCAGTSILASRCPLVATMRMWSGRSSHSTPFRIGRLSSVEAAKATCPTSLCTTPAAAFHAPSNLTAGKDGNSSRGNPSSLNFERPHSIATRDSPAAVNRTGPEGSSRAMSTSFFAGRVTAPSASTSAGTVRDRDVQVSAGEPQALLRHFDQNVGEHREGRLGRDRRRDTAQSLLQLLSRDRELHPSRRPFLEVCGVRLYYSTRIELLVVVVEGGEMLAVGLTGAQRSDSRPAVVQPRCGDCWYPGLSPQLRPLPTPAHTTRSRMLVTVRTTPDAPFRRAL